MNWSMASLILREPAASNSWSGTTDDSRENLRNGFFFPSFSREHRSMVTAESLLQSSLL